MKYDLKRFSAHQVAELESNPNDQQIVISILIPAYLVNAMINRFGKSGLRKILNHLLETHRKALLARDLPINHECTRSYQAKGLDLRKKSLRINSCQWQEFSFLAEFMGISSCHLFSTLLHMELFLPSTNVGTPTKIERYDLHHPEFLEIRKRVSGGYPYRKRREIHQQHKSPAATPNWLLPYPLNLEWLKLKIGSDDSEARSN